MKLTGKEKVSYGLGAVGKDMVYMFSASYVLYYYQDILGVSAIAMGIILMAARVFDAHWLLLPKLLPWCCPRSHQCRQRHCRRLVL